MSAEQHKIYITGPIYESGIKILKEKYGDANVEQWKSVEPCPYDLILQKSRECDALITQLSDKIDDQILSSPKLKIISQCAAGFDNIDLKSATAHKIVVANTPGVLTNACADFVFSLIMSLSRRVVESIRFVEEGGWKSYDLLGFLGLDVWGQTIGIIGPGRIGQAVAKRAKGFDMNILYYGRSEKPEMDAIGGKRVSLEELLTQSDFVVLSCPLNEGTLRLIGEKQFNMMKKTALLINIARGKCIDNDALLHALENNKIAGAALDVYDPEPVRPENPLLKFKNVIITSHIAGSTHSARDQMAILSANAIIDTYEGRPVQHLVNKDLNQ